MSGSSQVYVYDDTGKDINSISSIDIGAYYEKEANGTTAFLPTNSNKKYKIKIKALTSDSVVSIKEYKNDKVIDFKSFKDIINNNSEELTAEIDSTNKDELVLIDSNSREKFRMKSQ